ncbi:MAG: SDR family NAD(P)-dependent oxidoreductase [Candidatus Marinimicrobia bacterium]|nr:SDR family NAD(P)-dependent oxidoreductase [Candidatus Neomarinimicrobiota bacterium]
MSFELPDELKFITNSKLPQKRSYESMEGKICVISGATSGVGYESAISLAREGAEIVMLVRNAEKAKKVCENIKEVSGKVTRYFLADFCKLSEVRSAVNEILEAYPKIDVLINSVGIHNTTRRLTEDGYEMVFYVNHLSNFLVTKMMLPRMIESSPSRIIYVNSEGHRFGGLNFNDLNWEKRMYIGLAGYGAAKTAQLLTMMEFNKQLEGTGVTINAMHPGAVRTNIGNNNGWLYRFWLQKILWPSMKEPHIAGEAIYYLASSPDLEKVSGKFFNLTIEETPATHARDKVAAQHIYKISNDIISE